MLDPAALDWRVEGTAGRGIALRGRGLSLLARSRLRGNVILEIVLVLLCSAVIGWLLSILMGS